ncbi:Small auxin-up RNA protein [Dioscorea alata]|uniref:Small auxin-up RNA protein n=1 Tax=Dioscorea alata TaxID=55571 RepID=A0ACB7VWY3_DIOAL|nr:Small auxin-up RNA protein [Dioscorea alata]
MKKGCVAVRVGLEEDEGEFKRFLIPISYLNHPLFKDLLDKSQEVYGFDSSGPLTLPCSVDEFLHLRWHIEHESKPSHHRQNHRHHASFSCPTPCLDLSHL